MIPLPHGGTLVLGERTLVMGIVNVTPDSFAGSVSDPQAAVDLALRMVDAGADLIDIGGESTRPGAAEVQAADERRRVVPVIAALRDRVGVPISVDTYKAEVAEAAIEAGASIVNDISGLGYDRRTGEVVARTGSAVVLMHTRGRSADMYREAVYHDLVAEVRTELALALERADTAGIARSRTILDPGLGFAKRACHSWAALLATPRLADLGRPLLIGPSRKSFLTEAIGPVPPDARDWGTAAVVTAAVLMGAHIVRVHTVAPMVDTVRVSDMLRRYAGG